MVVITRKVHGTNFRAGVVKKVKLSIFDRIKLLFGNKWAGYEFVYGSHNVQKGSDTQGYYSTDVWKEAVDQYDIKKRLWEYIKARCNPADIGSGIVVFGEVYGQGIQGEHYTYGVGEELEEYKRKLAVFDFTVNDKYVNVSTFGYLAGILGLTKVPELYVGYFDRNIAESFNLNAYIHDKVPHEGVVIKSVTGDRKKVAKLINPEYLTFGEKFNVPDSH